MKHYHVFRFDDDEREFNTRDLKNELFLDCQVKDILHEKMLNFDRKLLV